MPGAKLEDYGGGRPLRVIGLMSGTSVDGVDVAMIETDGETVSAFGPAATYPYDDAGRAAIRAAFGRVIPDSLTDAAGAIVTARHIDAVRRFLSEKSLDPQTIDLIGFHGQTLTHKPDRRFTWQIGDGAQLARTLGVPVVDALRLADVAAGGQGAPLVPIYHAALVQGLELPVAVVNIGGIANVTWIGPGGELIAFDTGPGNGLLDSWVRRKSAVGFDRNGAISSAGNPRRDVVEAFRNSDYLYKKPPKSLDLNELRINLEVNVSLEDGAATLVCCTAVAIAEARMHFPSPPRKWIISGGGSNNINMLRSISNVLSETIFTARDMSWDSDALEAQAFAYLAARSVRRLPISFPRTTGAPSPMTGGVLHYP